jgi:Zn-dependent protease with chaperone function
LVIGLVGVALVGPSTTVEIPADEARVMTQVWLASGASSSGLQASTQSPVAAAVDRIARSLHAGLVGLPIPPELDGVVVAGGAGPMSLALPDGTVVVNEALLRVARSEAELAAVFAHGLAHVIRGDVAAQLTPSLPAVREALGAGAQAAAAALLTTALSTPPALDDELEVDRLALRILRSAGYNQRYYGQALTHALLPAPSPWATLHGFNEARIKPMKQLDENGRSGKAEYERDVRAKLGP